MISDELWINTIISRIDFWYTGSFFANLRAWYYWRHRAIFTEEGIVWIPIEGR